MNRGIVEKVLNFIRWDGTKDAYVRFLTLEDGGELIEPLKSEIAFREYFRKDFELWHPPYDKDQHSKSDVWNSASKIMEFLRSGSIEGFRDYRKHLFGKEGKESNIKFNPIARPRKDVWPWEAEEYTGLSKKEYEELCWLARPKLLFDKLNEFGEADKHLYIILYSEWEWVQVLRMIFPDIDWLTTEKHKSNAPIRPKIFYKYFFDFKHRLRFAYLNINQLSTENIVKFSKGLLKYQPKLKQIYRPGNP